MMMLIPIVILFGIISKIDCTARAIASKVEIYNGGTFIQYVYFDGDEVLTECKLTTNKTETIDIPLEGEMHTTNYFKDRLVNIGRGICGFQIKKFTKDDPDAYYLYAAYKYKNDKTDPSSSNFTLAAKIVSEANIADKETIKEIRVGTKVEILCPATYSAASCMLYNPKGILVFDDISASPCRYTIDISTVDELGTWKCVEGLPQNMQTAITYIHVQAAEEDSIKTWYNEVDGYGSIGCKFDYAKSTYTATYCSFVKPDGNILVISGGSATERYTTLGTNFISRICQIQFPLPLLESEKGQWQCKIDGTGGFINVAKTFSEITYPKSSEKLIKIGNSFEIACKVPYSSDNCFIEAPNGVIYYGGGFTKYWAGECYVKLDVSTEADIGVWSCHYSKNDNAVVDTVTVELHSEEYLYSLTSSITANKDETIDIICQTRSSIQSCRFVSPTQQSYVLPKYTSFGDMVYAGRGFEYGECGIRIKQLSEEHDGDWKCYIVTTDAVLGDNNTLNEISMTTRVSLETDYTTLAYSIGLPIGIIAAGLIVMASVYFAALKKNQSRRSSNSSEISSNSTNSNLRMFPATAQVPIYGENRH